MKEDSSDGEEEKSQEEIEKTSLQRDYEWNEKMRYCCFLFFLFLTISAETLNAV